ncbi:MAG: low specificity L-threonine aldolase, partial [Acetobacteraceae bacterium]|nr:low specificity L-threonine aldolase [Acetobacteraceae bacterium]
MSHEPPRFDLSIPIRINLYSDTQSKPSLGMMEAMMAAEVGDEQAGSDPTIWTLCDRVAALLGKEAAVFLPSGTMCNQVAIATHCRPGDEILAHEDAHIINSESGAPAAITGALVRGLTGPRGQFTAETLEEAIRPASRYAPPQRLVEVE